MKRGEGRLSVAKETKESDVCVCGHTRNYHRRGFFGGYEECRERVTRDVGNMVYLVHCECRRFEKKDGKE